MDVPSRASLACRWPHRGDPSRSDDRGYAMAALLVAMAVMGIMLSMALPVWRTAVKREREAELVFRGEQYAQAIELFSRRNGGFPPSLAVLKEGRYIRKLYKDPMTGEGDFQPVYFGQLLPGQATVPARAGRGGPSGGPGEGPSGGPGREPTGAQIGTPPGGRAGQPTGGAGQAEPIGAGPIIGVVSKSTAESLRLYNDRDHYNEWAFVAIAATAQPGAPGGTLNPGLGQPAVSGRGGRGARGAGRGARNQDPQQGAPGRGGQGFGRGQPPPGRGFQGPGGAQPGNPSGFQGGFPFPNGQQQGPTPRP